MRAGLVLAVAMALAQPAHAGLLRVKGAPVRTLRIGGKRSTYFRVEPGAPAGVHVRGPARVKLIVRCEPSVSTGPVRFMVRVEEGGHLLGRRTFEASIAADSTRWDDGGRATTSRALTVSVGKGEHELRVRVTSKAVRSVGLRPLRKRAHAGRDQVTIAAMGPAHSVTVHVRERPREYYVARKGEPVRVRVVGPTRLRVVTRYVFAEREHGRRGYALVVRRDGERVFGRKLETEKSLVAECPAKPHWIFGRSRTVHVEVPKGPHEIEIEPERNASPGVVVRFTIPREAIRHETR